MQRRNDCNGRTSKACASSTLSYLAHTILCVNNIQANASEEQKEKYLPKLISGEWIGCMGMSEPDYGSDAIGIQTRATQDGDDFITRLKDVDNKC